MLRRGHSFSPSSLYWDNSDLKKRTNVNIWHRNANVLMAKLELKSVLSGTPVGGSTPYVLLHHYNAGHDVFHSTACIFFCFASEDRGNGTQLGYNSNALFVIINENLEQLAAVQLLCRNIIFFLANIQSSRCMECVCVWCLRAMEVVRYWHLSCSHTWD